jgi:hypothetical protein
MGSNFNRQALPSLEFIDIDTSDIVEHKYVITPIPPKFGNNHGGWTCAAGLLPVCRKLHTLLNGVGLGPPE